MKHRSRSILSLVLVFALLCGAVPVRAQAADDEMQSGSLAVSKPTIEQIQEKYRSVTQADKRFDEQPSVTAPYATGKLNDGFLESGETYLNYIRYLAGLPEIELTDEKNDAAQHGAVLLAANDELTHYPDQPADMSDEFYKAGAAATQSSNISYRRGGDPLDALQSAVEGQMADSSGTSNMQTLGHRRWLLNPTLKNVGFGCADAVSGAVYIDVSVFDRSGSDVDYDFVAWPASGYMPVQEFDTNTPWSITVNPDRYQMPERGNLTITVTRTSDGASDTLDSATDQEPTETNAYLRVNTDGYGVRNAIIFRPDTSVFGSDTAGEYVVSVTGLYDTAGNAASLNYRVIFFDIESSAAGGDLADASVALSADGSTWTTQDGALHCTYDGGEQRPQVRVTYDGAELTAGTDYTVNYADNTDAGTATVTVTGAGSYTGAVTRTFVIDKAEQALTASLSASSIAAGGTAQITVSSSVGALSYQSSDPSVAEVDDAGVVTGVAPGEAVLTVTAQGDGNHNSVSRTLSITVVEAHTHTYGGEPVFTWSDDCASCTATFTCTMCDDTKTVDAEVTHQTTATCTADGETVHTASVTLDGTTYTDTRTESAPATGHAWDEGTVTTEPTCTEDGVKTYTCANCGETQTESIPATGHAWDESTVTTEPTCTEDGVRTYTCANCGETQSESIPALGHAWDEGTVTTEPTCTEDGVRTYTCANCGETQTESIPALGHAWDEGVITREPTHTQAGERTYTCTRCQATRTEEIPMLERTPVSEIFTDVPADAWFTPYVQDACDTGLMSGTSDTTFEPMSPLSRAMVVQILYANAGKPSVSGASPFSDVQGAGAWYYDAVVWAANQEVPVVSGYPDGTFRPNNSVLRQELATILYAAAGKPAVEGSLSGFADAGSVDSYVVDAMLWATQSGVISGSEENGARYLNPRKNTTRAEAAVMFLRCVEWNTEA